MKCTVYELKMKMFELVCAVDCWLLILGVFERLNAKKERRNGITAKKNGLFNS